MEKNTEIAVCDECGMDYDHKGHCDICGKAILSTWKMHDAVWGHERETDSEADARYERMYER
jgi:hypothetical protein